MLNVALTGNIAAGKSTVAELFRRWGATVIDADVLAREAEAPGSAVLAAIARRFGAGVIAPDGSLDRTGLRRLVMGDAAALADLNAIVHPAVHARRGALLAAARARGDRIVVSDIPLLFEAADPAAFDAVVLVDAPAALRRARLAASRGLSDDEIERLLGSQLPVEAKRARSDYVIENAGDLTALNQAARAVWESLQRRAGGRAPAALG
ncbi:MAG TPA: dephospho-CoA kinase [Gemmatimonadales bacterium]|nr:dephospho-CoA kinase [Gemmatimonadales bacterium]